MSARQLAGYCFLAITWGLSFLVLLKVVQAFGWVGGVTFRCFIAAGALFLAAKLMGLRLHFDAPWRRFAVIGASTVAVQLVLLSYALPLIGTAMSAILVATIPLFSMIIGQFWGLERFGPASLFGLVCGVAGLVLLVGFPAEPITPSFLIGCLASLASAFAAAFGSNYASRHLSGVRALEVTMAAFFFGGVMTMPLLAFVPVPGMPTMVDLGYLVIAGAVMSALTYVIYFWLVSEIGATRAISVEFAVTLVAVLIGAVWLGEAVTLVQLAGGAIIILGCAFVLGLVPLPRMNQVGD
jgi:drug/metabolite transporter (DMT)-like permease